MFSLKGRVILLTGAAGYLGRAMTEAILEAGGSLIIAGRTRDSLEALVETLGPSAGDRCQVEEVDLTAPASVAKLCERVRSTHSALHGIVNNAYSGRPGTIDAVGVEDFDLAGRLNVSGPFLLVKSLKDLLERGAGDVGGTASVVNISSMYARVSPDPAIYGDSGLNNPVHYGATKAALSQMTRYLAIHWGRHGIRVNSIAPGPFPDPGSSPQVDGLLEALESRVPVGRVGTPREVAGPTVFLLSEASSFVNGANLPVDGGWTAW